MDTSDLAMSAMMAMQGRTHAVTESEATDLMRSLQAPPDPHVLRVTVDYDSATDAAAVGMRLVPGLWPSLSSADRDDLLAAAAGVAAALRDLASRLIADA